MEQIVGEIARLIREASSRKYADATRYNEQKLEAYQSLLGAASLLRVYVESTCLPPLESLLAAEREYFAATGETPSIAYLWGPSSDSHSPSVLWPDPYRGRRRFLIGQRDHVQTLLWQAKRPLDALRATLPAVEFWGSEAAIYAARTLMSDAEHVPNAYPGLLIPVDIKRKVPRLRRFSNDTELSYKAWLPDDTRYLFGIDYEQLLAAIRDDLRLRR